jgi:HEPN domain-containing protein
MNVNIDNKSVLFFKAYEDIWAAERTLTGSPNIAVWHCAQAVEKTLKGVLQCLNMPYDGSHELEPLLEDIVSTVTMSDECKANVLNINIYKSGLRYKNMANDPSPEDARAIISRAKQIMQELNANPKISQFMDEAKEVHAKILKANLEKYGDT